MTKDSKKINKLLMKIEDPYDFRKMAPMGYDFLLKSAVGKHQHEYRRRVAVFSKHYNYHFKKSKNAYEIKSLNEISLNLEDQVPFDDSLTSLLFKRESIRSFVKSNIELGELSFLLKLSAGIKSKYPNTSILQKRFYPSGGALYTLKIYVDIRNSISIPKGLYLFNPYRNSLGLINGDYDDQNRFSFHNDSQEKNIIENSACEIIVTTDPRVSLAKYGEHGWRAILMESGFLGQNLWLISLGLGFNSYPCTSLNLKFFEKYFRSSVKMELPLISFIFGKE